MITYLIWPIIHLTDYCSHFSLGGVSLSKSGIVPTGLMRVICTQQLVWTLLSLLRVILIDTQVCSTAVTLEYAPHLLSINLYVRCLTALNSKHTRMYLTTQIPNLHCVCIVCVHVVNVDYLLQYVHVHFPPPQCLSLTTPPLMTSSLSPSGRCTLN